MNIDDQIAITSWNDTSQQDPLTLVFVGPGSISDNDFDLGREGLLANRLWVTLDGNRLYAGVDYDVQGQYLILGSGVIGPAQVLAVTEFTESIVPNAMAFRLFQDMRGVQTTFRITASTTTTVAQEISAIADIIYVTDASALTEPNLSDGIFGVITIDGERILYRVRDIATNSISGLQRGTAGTAATTHAVGTDVYDMGIGNRQPQQDQNYIVSDTSIGDGSTTIFNAPTINFDLADSSVEINSIEVYVGGNRARVGYYADQLVVGQTYTIASVSNTDWYAIGLPSDTYPAPGVVFTVTNNVVAANSFRTGHTYTIVTIGTTDWNSIGFVGTPTVGGSFTRNSTVLDNYGTGTASGVVGTGVAGTSLASNYYQESEYDPLAIQFLTANDLPPPAAGVEVVILQRRGVTWYAPGTSTPSDGQPLQLTNTDAARFLRGL